MSLIDPAGIDYWAPQYDAPSYFGAFFPRGNPPIIPDGTTYWAAPYRSRQYFTGGYYGVYSPELIPAPTDPTLISLRFGIGHWAATYFPFQYFTTPYYATNDAIAPDFTSAIRSVLISDAALRRLVPGGFRHRTNSPRAPYPKAMFSLVNTGGDEKVTGGGGSPYIRSGQLQISIYGANPDRIRTAANKIVAIFTQLPYLYWRKGHCMYLGLSDPSSPDAPTEGGAGAAIQGEMRIFDYQIQGDY